MYCSKCGIKSNSGDKFCSNCGNPINVANNTEVTNTVASEAKTTHNKVSKSFIIIMSILIVVLLFVSWRAYLDYQDNYYNDFIEDNENYWNDSYNSDEKLDESEVMVNFDEISNTISNAYNNPGSITKIIVKNFKLDNEETSLVLTPIPSTYGFDVYVNEKNVGLVGYGSLEIFDDKYLEISGYYNTTYYPNGSYLQYIDKNGDVIVDLDGYESIEWNEDYTILKYSKKNENNIKLENKPTEISCKNYNSSELSKTAYEEYTIEYKNGNFSEPSNAKLIKISEVCK